MKNNVNEECVRVHVLVSGLVQGVFFRESTRRVADSCAVFGWIKNLPSGKVEAVFEGPRSSVEKVLEHVRKGPRGATVQEIESTWEDYIGEFTSFQISRGV